MPPTIASISVNPLSGSGVSAEQVTRPAGARAGDILTTAFWLTEIGIPAAITGGWTTNTSRTGATDGDGALYIWSRVDDGSAGPWDVTWNGSTVISDWVTVAVRDSAGINRADSQFNTSSTSMTSPRLTTTVDGCLVVLFGTPSNPVTVLPPADMVEVSEDEATYVASVLQSRAGDTGNRVATLSGATTSLAALVAYSPTVVVPNTLAPTSVYMGESPSIYVY